MTRKFKFNHNQPHQLDTINIFVCLDSALSDEAKVKLADQCNLKVI